MQNRLLFVAFVMMIYQTHDIPPLPIILPPSSLGLSKKDTNLEQGMNVSSV